MKNNVIEMFVFLEEFPLNDLSPAVFLEFYSFEEPTPLNDFGPCLRKTNEKIVKWESCT